MLSCVEDVRIPCRIRHDVHVPYGAHRTSPGRICRGTIDFSAPRCPRTVRPCRRSWEQVVVPHTAETGDGELRCRRDMHDVVLVDHRERESETPGGAENHLIIGATARATPVSGLATIRANRVVAPKIEDAGHTSNRSGREEMQIVETIGHDDCELRWGT